MRFNPGDYVDVSDRITRFWKEYPDGAIRTELASPASAFTEVVFRAEVYKQRENPQPDAVGYAAEKPGNGANQTSWHENCETSAIGRALANMGYATSAKDRPSRQEMQKVNRSQEAAPPPEVRAARERQFVEMVNERQNGTTPDMGGPPLTDKQRGFLISLAKDLGMVSDGGHHDAAALDAEITQFCGLTMDTLTVGAAKQVIEEFQLRKKSMPHAEPHPMVQQALSDRESNWVAAMDGAATIGELKRIGLQIAEAKPANEEALRAVYHKHAARLQSKALA